jgi:hypothetical protein
MEQLARADAISAAVRGYIRETMDQLRAAGDAGEPPKAVTLARPADEIEQAALQQISETLREILPETSIALYDRIKKPAARRGASEPPSHRPI